MTVSPTLAAPTYTIDSKDCISAMSGDWPALFAAFGAEAVQSDSIVGLSSWEFVEGDAVRELLQALYLQIRVSGVPAFIPVRSDTATSRRLFELELRPLPDGSLEHIAWPLWSESRREVRWLDPACPRDSRTFACCGACMRINVADKVWHEIEDAEQSQPAHKSRSVPHLRLTICPGCRQSTLQTALM